MNEKRDKINGKRDIILDEEAFKELDEVMRGSDKDTIDYIVKNSDTIDFDRFINETGLAGTKIANKLFTKIVLHQIDQLEKKHAAGTKRIVKSETVEGEQRRRAPAIQLPALEETILDIIGKNRSGATMATLKSRTGVEPRQLSRALYKLRQQGRIKTKKRGVYLKE